MRTRLVNAWDGELAAAVSTSDLTIDLVDVSGLPPAPFYLVLDPLDDASREYCRVTGVSGATLTVVRNLDGMVAPEHDAGVVVRISYVAQILDDIHAEMDLYLPLTGGNLSGDTRLLSGSALGIGGVEASSPSITIRYEMPDLLFKGQDGLSILTLRNDGGVTMYAKDGAPDGVGWIPGNSAGGGTINLNGYAIMGRADMNMTNHKITNILAPTAPADAATKQYVDDNAGGSGDFMADGSVPMTSDFNAGGNTLVEVDRIHSATSQRLHLDAGSIEWLVGGTRKMLLDSSYLYVFNTLTMNGRRLVDLPDPTDATDAATKQYVDDSAGGGGGDFMADGSVPMTGILRFNRDSSLIADNGGTYILSSSSSSLTLQERSKQASVRLLSDGSIQFATTGTSMYELRVSPDGIYAYKPLVMDGGKITGVADPTDAQDAATKAWVEANFEPKP